MKEDIITFSSSNFFKFCTEYKEKQNSVSIIAYKSEYE